MAEFVGPFFIFAGRWLLAPYKTVGRRSANTFTIPSLSRQSNNRPIVFAVGLGRTRCINQPPITLTHSTKVVIIRALEYLV